jgi:type I restriction enzyme S subunit
MDELMTFCDRLEAQQQERETRHDALSRASLARFAGAPTPANLDLIFHRSYGISPDDVRNSVLALAVQGKLVPQDPNDRRPSVTRGRQFDGLFEVPENWDWIQLADLQPEFQNGASSRGDRDGTPIVVIRLADVESRRIALDNPRAIAIASEQIAKYRLQVGDTLITRVNGSADIVGTFIPVENAIDAIYCDHFIRMRIDPERLFPAYTALVGESQLVRDQIRSLFITTAGQKTVNQSHIRSLCIPLPPLAEQRRIVAIVDELMALVDELETQLATARTTGAILVEAVVARLTAEA